MNPSALTEQILALRKETDAFRESLRTRSEKLSYTFYDGPPFTSGDPHYGHLLQSIVKDMVPRWMTMRGYRVARKRWWDCHGIPAENFVNKKLGITSKKQVEEEFGLQNYIEACRSMVNQVNDNRKWTIDHIGRWVDMENAYFTMDNNFMESVICLFSDLYHRNLIYKWFKVLGYSRALGTALSNSEIAEWYEMRQDPAVTVKFSIKNALWAHNFLTAPDDDAIEVAAGVIKDEQGRVLMIFENKHNVWYFPGGKIERWESPADALKREIQEELGVEVLSEQFLGHVKTIHRSKLYRLHYFSITISGTPTIQEPVNHGMLEWIEKIPEENELGYVIKFADLVISDIEQIRYEFADIHFLARWLIGADHSGDASVSILPWTTTPWTLPANMFAAVHTDIRYLQLFDLQTREYYILAAACVSKYYQSPEQYIEVGRFSWAELIGLSYTPLFSYYHDAEKIDKTYKDRVHTILHADFVTTESGTGVVHEAPAFGADDYDLVATLLGRDNAQEWLFDPVNEYGEFTSAAPDFVGQNVIEANSTIIKELKSRGLLVRQETINHSYPHCPRTKTPLIYKAIESWFVKEDDLKAHTVPAAEQIHFVPDGVKQRFINGLSSAPDWNISRTRFWWAPLPVWECVDDPTLPPLVLSSRDEIFHWAKTGSKNITKFVLVRHGQTDYNAADGGRDAFWQAVLTDLGTKQAHDVVDILIEQQALPDRVVLSGYKRTFQTATPLLRLLVWEEFAGVEAVFMQLSDAFTTILRTDWFAAFFADSTTEKFFKLHDKVYVDYRITELFIVKELDGQRLRPDVPGEYCPTRSDEPATPGGESIKQQYTRAKEAIDMSGRLFAGETVLMVSHSATLRMLRMAITPYDFSSLRNDKVKRKNFHATPEIHYYDTHTQQWVDLHRPYIDAIWFVKEGKKYARIPEVLDCWFESGSMPYGQDHFMLSKTTETFTNCANFIAEGLDQTRGWFRALHVLGHAYHGQNVFQHVVVTGMILAEDGKKMSKSLQNYPDPTILINQYGADALRLYLLWSPVVRAEPLRFSEKWVEQMLKDVVIPLQNVFNFFKMYAEVDGRQDAGTQVWFMRHALKEQRNNMGDHDHDEELQEDIQLPLSAAWFAQLRSAEFIEQVIRINPEVIVCSDFLRAQQTAEGVKHILSDYLWKEIEIEYSSDWWWGMKPEEEFKEQNTYIEGEYAPDALPASEIYTKLLNKHAGKRVLIVSHKRRFRYLWQRLCNIQDDMHTSDALQKYFLKSEQPVSLPLRPITNELDQWVLAELHRTIGAVDSALQNYYLEDATQQLISFIEKLTNRYLRRSRRRFWSEEMTEDKQQAYDTLFTVIRTYVQLCAPFIPFVAEQVWQDLTAFTTTHVGDHPSLHLQSWPVGSSLYINQTLIDEIEQVRKIIKGALYIRAKHQIKVKQPLPSLSFRV